MKVKIKESKKNSKNANANAKDNLKTKKNKDAQKELAKKTIKREPKDLLYIYPTDIKTKEDKKTFRRQKRANNRSFIRKIEALLKSKEKGAEKELKSMQTEYADFQKTTYTKGKAPVKD